MSNHNASDTSSIPAKHARTASDAKSRPYPPDPQSDLIPLRKRTRGNPLAPTQDDSVICPSPVPLVVERRRVNPDSLAKRLGPDLVRDMEKHIYPGNKEMPTFAVRKELQERYNIDRRHIYDYFHSRGLRVVKEDRHGNLLRAREKNRRALFTDYDKQISRRPPVQNTDTPHVPKILTNNTASVRQSRVIAKLPSKRLGHKVNTRISKPQSPGLVNPSDGVTFRSPFRLAHPLDRSPNICGSDEDEYDSRLHNLHHDFSLMAKPMTEPMMELLDFPMTSSSANSEATSPLIASQTSAYQLSHDGPLSPRTREAVYDHLKDDLGPTCGFQESVGTYQAFMHQQARWYLDRLFRSHPQEFESDVATLHTLVQNEDIPPSSADSSPITRNGADFRKWMLFGYAKSSDNEDARSSLVPEGYPPRSDIISPELSPFMCPSSPSSVADFGGLVSFGSVPSDDRLPPFEDLFPESPMRLESYRSSEFMDSPVLHTENLDLTSKGDDKDIHLYEKQTANSNQQVLTQELTHNTAFNEKLLVSLPSCQLPESGAPQTLPTFPEIKYDVFHEEPAITRILPLQESNAHKSTEDSLPMSRSRTGTFSRSQAIRVMFEDERSRARSSTARLRRTRTSSAGGGI